MMDLTVFRERIACLASVTLYSEEAEILPASLSHLKGSDFAPTAHALLKELDAALHSVSPSPGEPSEEAMHAGVEAFRRKQGKGPLPAQIIRAVREAIDTAFRVDCVPPARIREIARATFDEVHDAHFKRDEIEPLLDRVVSRFTSTKGE